MTPRFGPLQVASDHERVVTCQLVSPGSRFATPHHPDAHTEDGAWYALRADTHRGHSGEDAVALRVPHALVLRRAIAEKVLGPLARDGVVSFRPVTLVSNRIEAELTRPRKLSDDWLMVDTARRFPLDRDTLEPGCFESRSWENTDEVLDARRPWCSLVSRLLSAPRWSEGRAPTHSVFRLLELPAELMAEEALLRRLGSALGEGVLLRELRDARLFPVAELNAAPPFPESDAHGEAAGGAFFRVASGAASRSDRGEILRSPFWSWALARTLEGPADDTREAACRHPVTAAAYARDVDRAARADTRDAACGHPGSAISYMRHVDRGPHPATSSAFRDHLRVSKLEVEARALAERRVTPHTAPTRKPATQNGQGVTATPSRWVGLDASNAPMVAWRDGRTSPHAAPGVTEPAVGLIVLGAKTAAAAKKKTAKWNTLSAPGWMVFRRSVVEPALSGITDPALRWHAVSLVDATGVTVDEDWVVLEVTREWPLDRQACEATYHDRSNPHGTAVLQVAEVAYGAGRSPDVAAFLIGELPSIAVFRPEVADLIAKAVGRGLSCCKSLRLLPSYPRVGRTEQLGASSAATANAAAEAFWQLVAGSGDCALRADVCKSPHYGYWLARVVDQAPADDTRAAALLHTHYAAEYAQLVDRAGREDTRKVAAAHGLSALHYAKYVDRALKPTIVAALHEAGWGDTDLDTLGLPRQP